MTIASLLGHTALPVIFGCFFAPVLFFLAALGIRWRRGAMQSAAADLILIILFFDISVLCGYTEFQKYLGDPGLRQNIVVIHLGFLLISILLWIFSIGWVEAAIASYHEGRRGISMEKAGASFPIKGFVSCWVFAATLFYLHITLFTQPGPS